MAKQRADPVALSLSAIAETLTAQERQRQSLASEARRLDLSLAAAERAQGSENRAAARFTQELSEFDLDSDVRAAKRLGARRKLQVGALQDRLLAGSLDDLSDEDIELLRVEGKIRPVTGDVQSLGELANQRLRTERLLDPDEGFILEDVLEEEEVALLRAVNKFDKDISAHLAIKFGSQFPGMDLDLARQSVRILNGFLRRKEQRGEASARSWARRQMAGKTIDETVSLARQLLPDHLQSLVDNFEAIDQGRPVPVDPSFVGPPAEEQLVPLFNPPLDPTSRLQRRQMMGERTVDF